jgi:hypothetical protein
MARCCTNGKGFIGLYLRDVQGHLEARLGCHLIQRIEEYIWNCRVVRCVPRS